MSQWWDDRPANLADHFVDRVVREGGGERFALLTRSERFTYSNLQRIVNRTAHGLTSLGLRRGDRVLLALNDGIEFVATWFAAQKLGAVTAEVYTFLQPKDYAYYLQYTEAGVVVVDPTTLAALREARSLSGRTPQLVCAGDGGGDDVVGFDALIDGQAEELEAAPTRTGDIAIWKFTTGSTGRPKACVHAVRSPLVSFDGYARGVLDLRADDVVLPVPKLFFGYARDLAALFPLGVGGAGIAFPERPTPDLIFELIDRFRPSILVNVPTMMQAMVDHPDAYRQDLGCLRLCTSAGEALPDALHRRWLDRFGVEVLDGIGSSEAYHIYVSNRPGRVRIGSMGEAVPGYAATVVDDEGTAVPDGETGRLWINGESAALMYWGDEERSRETFADRLVMSGDLVERDGDGFFWYRGRADDLLKVAGIWVAPAEIERCITAHEDVVECAVVGVERDGLTVGCACVVVREPSPMASAEAVRSHVRARLAPHKVPAEVVFLPSLPRTGSGKIDRAVLRNEVEAATAPAPAS